MTLPGWTGGTGAADAGCTSPAVSSRRRWSQLAASGLWDSCWTLPRKAHALRYAIRMPPSRPQTPPSAFASWPRMVPIRPSKG